VFILAGKPILSDQSSNNGQANSKNSNKKITPKTNGGIPGTNPNPPKPVHERRERHLPKLNPEDLKQPATQ
jgi:hypothetical protein